MGDSMMRWILALAMALLTMVQPAVAAEKVKVTVLSTMLADIPGRGEWGYAALVEVDGRRILFDTGADTDTVLKNAQALGVELSNVEEVVISHNHWDHVNGLVSLRQAMMARNPKALSVVHIGAGAFQRGGPGTARVDIKTPYEATGGRFVVHDGPAEIAPGVWLTGPVPRVYPETNCCKAGILQADGTLTPDTVPEDNSLVIRTPDGLVVIAGCAHAGIVNIVTAARRIAGPQPISALIGGLHLADAKGSTIEWVAAKLKEIGVAQFLSGHCTGLEPTRRLATVLGLSPADAVYGPVGGSWERGKGIDPRRIARPIPAG
jgi:7,8-dihydropterin-6-yl-methyl-4-(beta-D-ribofuranosyl)aminobenzene 5'-phosphate synthase